MPHLLFQYGWTHFEYQLICYVTGHIVFCSIYVGCFKFVINKVKGICMNKIYPVSTGCLLTSHTIV